MKAAMFRVVLYDGDRKTTAVEDTKAGAEAEAMRWWRRFYGKARPIGIKVVALNRLGKMKQIVRWGRIGKGAR